jgi:hypothetical protein
MRFCWYPRSQGEASNFDRLITKTKTGPIEEGALSFRALCERVERGVQQRPRNSGGNEISLYSAFSCRTVSTGTLDSRTTRSATDPNTSRSNPVDPCVEITIRSAFSFSAS